MMDILFAFLSIVSLLFSVFFLYRARKSYKAASIANKNLKNGYAGMIYRTMRTNSIPAINPMVNISDYAIGINKVPLHIMSSAVYDDAEISNSKNDSVKYHQEVLGGNDDKLGESIFLKNQYEL